MSSSNINIKASIPNLFDYATKELSQDAFFCWLIAWADPVHKQANPPLHKVGRIFLGLLLLEHLLAAKPGATVKVHRQYKFIDILAEVGDDIILLVEDKIRAGIHGNQLERYKALVTEDFPGRKVASIYLKTGDQSNYLSVEHAGFVRFGRDKVLGFLELACKECDHPVLEDFRKSMEKLERAVSSFSEVPPVKWQGDDPWIGLYIRLQKDIPDMEWQYVSNPRGGFQAALFSWLPWTDPASGIVQHVYLQIEQGRLAFKIEAGSEEKTGPRDRWRARITEFGDRSDHVIEAPDRMRPGKWMTVGILEQVDWLALGDNGLVDTDATIAKLRGLASLMAEAAD